VRSGLESCSRRLASFNISMINVANSLALNSANFCLPCKTNHEIKSFILSFCKLSTTSLCNMIAIIIVIAKMSSFYCLQLTWFLVEENDGFTGRNGTVVVSLTRALWFWVASQTDDECTEIKDIRGPCKDTKLFFEC